MSGPDRRAFVRLTRAWLRGIVRDRAAIFWFFLLPLLFVVILGLAFGGSDVGAYHIGLVVDDSTPAGRALTASFGTVKPFQLSTGSLERELQKLRDGDRYAVVTTLPPASASVAPTGIVAATGGTPGASQQAAPTSTVQVYYDPSRGAAAQIVLPIIRQVVSGVDQQLSGRPPALTVEERSVRSSSLRFIDFFLPGIMGFSIMQGGMFAAIPLVQLRTSRVLKRMGATPVSRWVVLLSQGAARLIMASASAVVLLVAGKLLFDLHISANWLALTGFVLLGGVTFLCFGFAVSGLAPTEESVPALVQVVSFPMMFLSGVFFPIENFPAFVQPLARALPLTFLADGLRQAMVDGAALNPQWVNLLVLAGWSALAGALAVRFFKWE